MSHISKNIEITGPHIGLVDTPALKIKINKFPMYCWDLDLKDAERKGVDEIIDKMHSMGAKSILIEYADGVLSEGEIIDDETIRNNDSCFFMYDLSNKLTDGEKLWFYPNVSRKKLLEDFDLYIMKPNIVFIFGEYDPEFSSFEGNKPAYRRSFNQTIWETCGKSRLFKDSTSKYDKNYISWLKNLRNN